VFEKEKEIIDDPRGVYLAGDAVRILYHLGLGKHMKAIGHGTFVHEAHSAPALRKYQTDSVAEISEVNFHYTDFKSEPFIRININSDMLHQSVPTGILQIQPELGRPVLSFRLCGFWLTT
jgi:hypothetical protein